MPVLGIHRLGWLLLLGPPALAQQYSYVAGFVLDPSGAAVPDAAISVLNENTGFRRLAQSQSNGAYAVASLEPGSYKITVRRQGFRTLVRFGVKLNAAQPAQVDFLLSLGSMQEVITVRGTPPAINTEDASAGALIARERIEKLPLNGRSLLGLLELAPGTIVTPATRGEPGQFTTSGQRANANYFVIDGVSGNSGVSAGGLPAQTTGGSLPALTALGTLHSLISLEALDEFRIQTSTATPEFGKLPGALVVLSSRSGSNEFHGSLFNSARHDALDAQDWFARRSSGGAPLRMFNFGGGAGGPLRRDRTFFFLSYEGMRLREPFVREAAVPSAAIRETVQDWQARVLNLFPLPTGREVAPNLAEWSRPLRRRSGLDVAGLRLDHGLTSRISLFARYNDALSSNEFTSTQVNDLAMRSSSLTLGVNVRLTHRAVVDWKLNHSAARVRSSWRPARGDPVCALEPVARRFLYRESFCDYLFRFYIGGVGQVFFGREPDQRQGQWQMLPAATVQLGGHQLRLGLDYRRLRPSRSDHTGSLSLIAETFDDLLAGRDLWVGQSGVLPVRSTLEEFSAFAQDTWRLHPRLTATLGVRWEYADPPALGADLNTASSFAVYRFREQRAMWSSRQANLGPRAALAWRPFRRRTFVVRSGGGLYFDSSLSLATDVVNRGPLSVSLFSNPKYAPFSTVLSYGFVPELRLPAVEQWNITAEGAVAGRDLLSVGYVGSAGRRLLRREFGGLNLSRTLWLALATNHGESSYHGLHVQYRRPLSSRLQAQVAYAWSHSIDNSSSDALLHRTGLGVDLEQDRGASDFDARHALAASFGYEVPRAKGRLLGGWGWDGIFRARSGFPITVLNSEYSMGLSFANAFRPDLLAGAPVWTRDSAAPGGRRLNRDAFRATPPQTQGSLGRNAIRGFGMHQLDVALRREFSLRGEQALQVRLEAFNLLNHPNFADPVRFLSSPLFGSSPSMLNLMLGTGSPGSGLTPALQSGGPRSVQLALRWRF